MTYKLADIAVGKTLSDVGADAFTEQMDVLYAESNERYGVIPEGENAATPNTDSI